MKRYILLIMIILLSFSVFATESLESFSLAEDYPFSQANNLKFGVNELLTTDYSFVSNTITSSTATESNLLIADLDGDGDNEILSLTTTTLYVQSVVAGLIVVDASYSHGGTSAPNGLALMQTENFDVDSFDQIFFIVNETTLNHVEFNGTSINLVNEYVNASIFVNADTGLTCSEDGSCYFGSATCDIVEYDSFTNTAMNYSIGGGANCFQDFVSSTLTGIFDHESQTMVIDDIDFDSANELIHFADFDSDNRIGLFVYDTVNHALDNSFSFDGKLDDITDASDLAKIGGVAVINLDGGTPEIVFSYGGRKSSSPITSGFKVYSSSGVEQITLQTSLTLNGGSASYNYASPPIAANIINDSAGDTEICVLTASFDDITSARTSYSLCVDSSYATVDNTLAASLWRAENVNILGSSAGIGDVGGATVDILFSNQVFSPNGDITDSVYNTGYVISYGDVDGDNYGDICGVETISGTGLFCAFGNDTNFPPVLNNSQIKGGYGSSFDYDNPICVNTSITFSASQDNNYGNDLALDRERIVTNCGSESDYTTNLINGTFSYTTPQYSCVFNETGVFPVRLYLEDDANIGDRTQYNTQDITVTILNGIAGNTCNLGTITAGDTGSIASGSSAVDESIEDTLGILTGTSDNMKLLLAFVIIIGLVWTTANQGITNPSALGLIAILGISFVTFFGLLPTWVMITVISTIVILGILKVAVAGSGAE